MRRYYDAHLYYENWGTHRVMFRLPRTLLDPGVAQQYCVDPQVSVSATRDHLILDMNSEDDWGYWEEDLDGSLSAFVGGRSELATGDLRPLYLAWLSGYSTWERDEDAFDDQDEDVVEPPVPAGLGSLTASQRALADFLRVDADPLDVGAEASPALPEVKAADPPALALMFKCPLRRPGRESTPSRSCKALRPHTGSSARLEGCPRAKPP